jgi:hypothetical protein
MEMHRLGRNHAVSALVNAWDSVGASVKGARYQPPAVLSATVRTPLLSPVVFFASRRLHQPQQQRAEFNIGRWQRSCPRQLDSVY